MTTMEEISSALAGVIPEQSFLVRGAWAIATRSLDADEVAASDTERRERDLVLDARWSATIECDVPLAGVAFLCRRDGAYWGKSAPAKSSPAVHVSLHASALDTNGRASFGVGMEGIGLPAVPFPRRADLLAGCALGPATGVTGRSTVVAEVESATFSVLLLPASALEVGRNRLWSLRQELAKRLPADVRALLTHGRTGVI